MNEGYFYLLAGSLVLGVTLIYTGLKRHRRLRHVEDSPCSKIASAPQGFVELQGFAWPKQGSQQTLSGRECVYYLLSLEREETRGSGKNRRKVWVKVFGFSFLKPFYLLDPTGLAEVHPASAECEFNGSQSRLWSRLPTGEKEKLKEMVSGVSGFPPSEGFLGLLSTKYRVTETFVPVGSPAYVSGNFSSEAGDSVGVRDGALSSFARKVLNVQGRGFKNVEILLDQNKDGKISESESREGYANAARAAMSNPDLEPTENKVFGKVESSADHKLFLADVHEGHLKERLSKGIWLRLAGGAASVAVGVVMGLRLFVSDQVIDQTFKNTIVDDSAIESGLSSLAGNPSREPQNQQETRRLEQEMIQKAIVARVGQYHQECLQGQAAACSDLLNNKQRLALSADYVQLYQKKACDLGLTVYCQ